jgi:signal transduction histidine kinase
MQIVDSKLARTVSSIAGIVAIVVAITLPLSYFSISYQYQVGMLDAQAEINSRIASQVINANPELWRFMGERLNDFLSRRAAGGYPEVRRIVDNDNKVIAQSADTLDSPTIMRSAELRDSGVVVGRIEIVRSLRPVLVRSAGVGLFALLLSCMAFAALKILPLRALNRAVAENTRLLGETESRAREQAALSTIAMAASQSLDIHEMLQQALEKTLEVTKRTIGIVRLKDDDTGRLRVVGYKGISESYANALDSQQRIGRMALEVLSTAEMRILNNPLSPEERMEDSRTEDIQSRVWVPIQARGRILGVLTVGSKIIQPFDIGEIELLKTIGSIFGTAVANARLYEKTQHDLQRIQALRQIDQAITSTMDLRTRLKILLEKIDLFFPYPSATAIRLVDKQTGELEFLACRHMDEAAWKRRAKASPGVRAKQVVDTKSPVMERHITPIAQEPDFYKGLASYLALPLIVKDEVIGVLSLYTKEEHDFTQEEVESLEMLVSQAAIAIHEAQLYEETERRRREAEELGRVAQSLTETLDMTAVGERIVASVSKLFDVKASTLRLLQPDGSLRAIAASGEAFAQAPGGQTIHSRKGLTTRAVAEGKPLWSADVLSDPTIALTDPMRAYQLESGNRSVIAVPLRAHENIIGALALSDQTGRTYSGNDVALLQTFADQAALALENARLFDEVKQNIDDLQQKTSELERANKAKDEFLSIVSHELRTPLNVVIGFSAMLQEGILGKINSKQEEVLGKILDRANDQLKLINSILQATQIGAGTVSVLREDVDLKEFIEELKSRYDFPLKKEVTLQWQYSSELPIVKSDSDKLKHILQNIIDNAIKFTEKGRIIVSVQSMSESGIIEFKVTDTGVGIPKAMQPVIFEMFRQVDSSENRPFEGVGLGLYIVKKLAEILGGKVEVESEEGQGSTFIVTVPSERPPEEIPSPAYVSARLNESSRNVRI